MKNAHKSQAKQTPGPIKPQARPGKMPPLEKSQPPETTIQASEEKFRRLFEASQDGILLLDAGTGIIGDVNPFVIEFLGYSRAELIGKKFWETCPFQNVSASREAFLKLQKKRHFRYDNL
jgi:PAS domain-containing protein